jgi:glycosyltransferase involved in cell wall biosynthesis
MSTPTAREDGALNVLQLIPRLSPTGGAETSLAQLTGPLRRHDVVSTVVALKDHPDSRPVARLRQGGVPVHVLGDVSRIRQTARLVKLIRRLRPDLLHTTLLEAGIVGRIAAWVTRTPVLHSIVNTVYRGDTTRAYGPAWKSRVFFFAEWILAKFATSHFHVLTEASAIEVARTFPVPRTRLTVVPRGRDPHELGARTPERRALSREALGVSSQAPVLVNVARQEHQKGQVHLVRAFAEICNDVPDATLVIAGRRGAASDDLEAAILRSGLQDRILLLGAIDDVGTLLCAADLFVFSSLWEGLGGAVLEAMAMGVPVVTFAVPAVCEVIDGAGVAVPIGDADALAEAAAALLLDPARSARTAAMARDRFNQLFTVERVASQMAALYQGVSRKSPAQDRGRR